MNKKKKWRKRRNRKKKRKKKMGKYIPRPLVVFVDWLLLGYSFNTLPDHFHFCITFNFLLALTLQSCQRWKHKVLLGLFRACAWLFKFPVCMNAIHAILSKKKKKSSFQLFLPGFGCCIVCLTVIFFSGNCGGFVYLTTFSKNSYHFSEQVPS